jgi:hypothetical protein
MYRFIFSTRILQSSGDRWVSAGSPWHWEHRVAKRPAGASVDPVGPTAGEGEFVRFLWGPGMIMRRMKKAAAAPAVMSRARLLERGGREFKGFLQSVF